MASDVGSRIRALRHARSLRRVDVARAADVTSSWLSRLERGLVPNPGAEVVARIARVFGVSPEHLLMGQPEPRPAADATPTAEQNRAVIEDLVTEVVNHGNMDVADLVLAPTYIVHGPFPDVTFDRVILKRAIQRLRRAFPDITVTLDDVVADTHRVVVRWRLAGSHRGAVGEALPTGAPITYSGIAIFGMEGGRVTEGWMVGDTTHRALLTQLGLFPAPPG